MRQKRNRGNTKYFSLKSFTEINQKYVETFECAGQMSIYYTIQQFNNTETKTTYYDDFITGL